MNCPICHDIIVDTAFAKCEWCRLGAPMESALEEGPVFNVEGRRAIADSMASHIQANLRRQSLSRRILAVQQVDPGIKAAVDFHANHPFSPQPTTKESLKEVDKFGKALTSGMGIPPSYMGFVTWKDDSSQKKYADGWDRVFGEKK